MHIHTLLSLFISFSFYLTNLLFAGAVRTTCILDVETKPFYWITVCAQDQAVVPLYTCVEVRK